MKNKVQIILVAVAVTFIAGCHSSPKPKPVYERGWIGSDFQRATRDLRPKGERAAVYVRQVYARTPSAEAGLQPADLIVAFDGEPVTHMRDFRARVDAAKPGQVVKITALRNGERVEVPLTVGRERYQTWHSIQFGFGYSSHLDIFPDPNFTLLPVAQFRRETDRVELNSPESALKRNARKSAGKDSEGFSSKEGWNAWLVIVGLGAHKKIVSQDIVVAQRARR